MGASTMLLVGPSLSRAGLKSLLEGAQFKIVGEVADVSLLSRGADPDPDIALVEAPADPKIVLEALQRLDEVFPDTAAVILSDEICMAALAGCLAAGASGFLTKDISPDALLRSLQLVALGEKVFPTYLAGLLVHGVPDRGQLRAAADNSCGLSDREIETLQCLLRGESNKLIAKRLSISEATIKVHMKSVLRKIKASNRTQAAIWAISHGYMPVRDSLAGAVAKGRFGLG
ncbi:MAG: response regulator [Alphaproteobacteria bacterium]|nr:response regulator [Alphaproteobacteria bacterium]